jgi:hypothetical protein
MALAYTRLGKTENDTECDGEDSAPAIKPISAGRPKTPPAGPRIKDDIADAVHFLEGVLRDLTQLVTSQTENVALRPYVDERLAGMSAGFYSALEEHDEKGHDNIPHTVSVLLAANEGICKRIAKIEHKLEENRESRVDLALAECIDERFKEILALIDERSQAAKTERATLSYMVNEKVASITKQVATIDKCERDNAWIVAKQNNHSTMLADLRVEHDTLAGEVMQAEADLRAGSTALSKQLESLRHQVEILLHERRLARQPLWKRFATALTRR